MNDEDLKKLSIEELNNLTKSAQEIINQRRINKADNLVKNIIDLIEKSDFTIKEIMPLLNKKKSQSKIKPKYANPKNNAETWTGRGKTPTWAEKYKKNGELENCLI
jgi:DNA-binding protein H-NS